jgi:hypothetical protein
MLGFSICLSYKGSWLSALIPEIMRLIGDGIVFDFENFGSRWCYSLYRYGVAENLI